MCPEAVVARSQAYGTALAAHILDWSEADGALPIVNMGFPLEYALGTEPGSWVPTTWSKQQQVPLLPAWGTMSGPSPWRMAAPVRCRRRRPIARRRARNSIARRWRSMTPFAT